MPADCAADAVSREEGGSKEDVPRVLRASKCRGSLEDDPFTDSSVAYCTLRAVTTIAGIAAALTIAALRLVATSVAPLPLVGAPATFESRRMASLGASTQRVFDLVLFSAADKELVPLRIRELKGTVDVLVLAETDFKFSDGSPKPLAFDPSWTSMGVDVRHFVITKAGLEACGKSALKQGGATVVRDDRLRKRAGLLQAKCRESFGRNALLQAFNELGGTDADVAVLSDADEIPRAESMGIVRSLATGKVAVSMGAIHHFKYNLRCERGWRARMPGATWLKGPIATSGQYLREAGAQSIRTIEGCVAAGMVGNRCHSSLSRKALANSSWHMSSMSGGVDGAVRKMRDNAANALYDKNETLFKTSTVLERAWRCQHGENLARSRGAKGYEHTPWGRHQLPRYPDVPASLEAALGQKQLPHFLGWESDVEHDPQVWSPLRAAPIELAAVRPGDFKITYGPCNYGGCHARGRSSTASG
jgi:hypothetical protein